MQQEVEAKKAKEMAISIHAPYKGCNHIASGSFPRSQVFQSMHPIKDATPLSPLQISSFLISIHAPYKGCNPITKYKAKADENFNPCTL